MNHEKTPKEASCTSNPTVKWNVSANTLNISASVLKEVTDIGGPIQVLEPTPEKSIAMDNLLEKLETNQADTGEEGWTY